MLMQKLEGEKLKRVKAGVDGFCCWGGPGDGCDCTSSTSGFSSISDVWTSRLEFLQDRP